MGAAWQALAGQYEQLKEWVDKGLTLTKIHALLGRRGVVVSYRTLHRYATKELGFGRRCVRGLRTCHRGAVLPATPEADRNTVKGHKLIRATRLVCIFVKPFGHTDRRAGCELDYFT